MVTRRMIEIDEALCNGCGICAEACHEKAIGMVEGKAKLLRDDYCDGLGDCLPACPTNAISFVQRQAKAYDHEAVQENIKRLEEESDTTTTNHTTTKGISQLRQWPIQIQLVPIQAEYFNHAHILVAADCGAYACGDFHDKFMKNKASIIGCPKLDQTDYSVKLTEIFKQNDVKSVTIVRMEVPCCGGLEMAVRKALENCGKEITFQVVVLSIKGEVVRWS